MLPADMAGRETGRGELDGVPGTPLESGLLESVFRFLRIRHHRASRIEGLVSLLTSAEITIRIETDPEMILAKEWRESRLDFC